MSRQLVRACDTSAVTLEGLTSCVPFLVAAFESYPDGGFQAWLQVFCCFCILFTTVGGIYTCMYQLFVVSRLSPS